MGKCKEIVVKVIPAPIARRFIRTHHYSRKVVANSRVHFGVFLDQGMHGVLSFGSTMVKHNMIGLVADTKWDGFIELNRMAFDDYLPRNSESRAIAICLRMIRKQAPQVKWVVSFADACLCGDGTIYRASGFVLTGLLKNEHNYMMPDGEVVADMDFAPTVAPQRYQRYGGKLVPKMQALRDAGAVKMKGFQLRYIYFLDKSARGRLTVPEIPFSEIEQRGAAMYKGKSRVGSVDNDTSAIPAEKGGAIPTPALQT